MAAASTRRLSGALALIPIFLLAILALAPGARAADRVYWGNEEKGGISFANLDGSGGGNLTIFDATVNDPLGIAFDPAAGRIYWTNERTPGGLAWANVDGSEGVRPETASGAEGASGVVVDHASGRVYWAVQAKNEIFSAALDGSGGAPINTTGTTVDDPSGLAVDPSTGRIYWANSGNETISFANLDGSGGGTLISPTAGVTIKGPDGVAIDEANGRIYWSNLLTPAISSANLDGSDPGTLNTGSASVVQPDGIAVDPLAGRVYWADINGEKIGYASVDGSGGANLSTGGATVFHPQSPVLLEEPRGTGAPTLRGGSTTDSQLTCSDGSWAPDLIASNLYQAPQSFAYSWSRDGAPFPGTTANVTATEAGSYVCQVTASNAAGSATQTSTIVSVGGVGFGKLTRNRRNGTVKLRVKLPSTGRVTLRGGQVRALFHNSTGRRTLALTIRPKRQLAHALGHRLHHVKVAFTVTFTPAEGVPLSKHRSLVLIKRR